MINFYFSDKDYENNEILLGLFNWEANNSWYDELAEKIYDITKLYGRVNINE